MNYEEYENIDKVKLKIRMCKFCKNKKETRYIIHETTDHHRKGKTKDICDSCLKFIVGMHNFGQCS